MVPHSFFLKYLPEGVQDVTDEKGKVSKFNFKEKYLQWHCKQFTDHNRKIKWCPAKNCNYIIEKNDFAEKDIVQCKCGHSFCFKCMEEEHQPTSCKQVEQWNEKEKSDSENLTWIKANCKPCPKCHSNIEKNQGCMHITCRECKHDFCWLCLGVWKEHGERTGGYYSCNIYTELKKTDKDLQKREAVIEESKNEMTRYIFHYERFNNHFKSGQLVKKQMIKIKKSAHLLHEVKNYPNSELNFFEDCSKEI